MTEHVGGSQGVLRSRRRMRRLGRILLAFFVGGVSFVNVGADGCGGPYPATPNPLVSAASPPVRAHSGRPLRVLLVGDSVLDQMGHHAEIALRQAGAEVRTVGIWGSGLFTRAQYDMGAVAANPPPGTWLGDAPVLIADFDPDIVAIYLNHNYWSPYPRDAQGNDIPFGGPVFVGMAQALLREFAERLSTAGAAIYLVKPLPPAAGNPIFNAYLTLQSELGYGIVYAGDAVAKNGERLETMSACAGFGANVRPPNDLHLTYYGAGVTGTALARGIAQVSGLDLHGATAPMDGLVNARVDSASGGYRTFACDGASFQFGNATFEGGAAIGGGRADGDPIVSAATRPSGLGYWMLAMSGNVLVFGDAPNLGRTTGSKAQAIAATPSGNGYWIMSDKGIVSAFGDAVAHGSLPQGANLTGRVMATAADGNGYWIATNDNRLYSFGSAPQLAAQGAIVTPWPPTDMARTPSGNGLRLLDLTGEVTSLGDAVPMGDVVASDLLVVDPALHRIRLNPLNGAQRVVPAIGHAVQRFGVANAGSGGARRAVAGDANGNLFVADAAAHAVYRIDGTSGALTLLSSGGSLVAPSGITVASDGSLLVADAGSAAILRVDPVTGARTTVTSGGQLVAPSGVVDFGTLGMIVSDAGAAGIFFINPTTGSQTRLQLGASNPYVAPSAITGVWYYAAVVWVTDPGTASIRTATVILDGAGGATMYGEGQYAAGGNIAAPSGIAFHPQGGMVIAEPATSRLVRIATDGTQSIVANGGSLIAPAGIATLPGRVPSGTPVGLSMTLSGNGYWIVTTASQAYHVGDAADLGDISHLALKY